MENNMSNNNTAAKYILRKNNRKVKGVIFDTYEKARAHARSLIRKDKFGWFNADYRDTWDNVSRNPSSIGYYGFEVSKV